MRVETVQANGPSSWVVGLVGTQSERFRKVTLSSADVERLTVIDAHPSYDDDGRLLRLGSPEPRSGASCSERLRHERRLGRRA
jgi:hypothetical protein